MEEIHIRRMADMHCHFRSDEMLRRVILFTAAYCQYGLAMPNTRPQAILSASDIESYRNKIYSLVADKGYNFSPVMTIEIRDNTTIEMIEDAFEVGAVAGKVYPLGVTTNSDQGMRDFKKAAPLFKKMEELGMKLLVHGESPDAHVLVIDREHKFLPTMQWLIDTFPNLRIVMEHITTKSAVELVTESPWTVAATITGHHLCLTLNDIIGSGIRPHHYCMPVAKRFSDRDALVAAATSGNPKFFLGSDTAPHMKGAKESSCGCAGIYTAPVLPSLLAGIFEREQTLDKLEDFTSTFGCLFYNLPITKDTIRLVKEDWVVPNKYQGIVPFKAGEVLHWQLAS